MLGKQAAELIKAIDAIESASGSADTSVPGELLQIYRDARKAFNITFTNDDDPPEFEDIVIRDRNLYTRLTEDTLKKAQQQASEAASTTQVKRIPKPRIINTKAQWSEEMENDAWRIISLVSHTTYWQTASTYLHLSNLKSLIECAVAMERHERKREKPMYQQERFDKIMGLFGDDLRACADDDSTMTKEDWCNLLNNIGARNPAGTIRR